MPTMIVTGTAGGSPSAMRKKPKRALRGRRRHAVQKLLHYLNVIVNQDDKEQDRADVLGYTPYLIRVRNGNPNDAAIGRLRQRCVDALAAVVD